MRRARASAPVIVKRNGEACAGPPPGRPSSEVGTIRLGEWGRARPLPPPEPARRIPRTALGRSRAAVLPGRLQRETESRQGVPSRRPPGPSDGIAFLGLPAALIQRGRIRLAGARFLRMNHYWMGPFQPFPG